MYPLCFVTYVEMVQIRLIKLIHVDCISRIICAYNIPKEVKGICEVQKLVLSNCQASSWRPLRRGVGLDELIRVRLYQIKVIKENPIPVRELYFELVPKVCLGLWRVARRIDDRHEDGGGVQFELSPSSSALVHSSLVYQSKRGVVEEKNPSFSFLGWEDDYVVIQLDDIHGNHREEVSSFKFLWAYNERGWGDGSNPIPNNVLSMLAS